MPKFRRLAIPLQPDKIKYYGISCINHCGGNRHHGQFRLPGRYNQLIMAKKAKTRKEQYREILAKYGKNLDDCDIMAFRFADEYRPDIFHFELMNPLRPVYHLFDATGNVAIVIVPKDPENARKMALLAESCGGEKTIPNLW